MNVVFVSLAFFLLFGELLGNPAQDRVLQVVDVVNGTFVPDFDNLRYIFSQVPVETEVGVISIAGEYRKGKSFLLNFFLQYLEHRCSHRSAVPFDSQNETGNEATTRAHAWLHDVKRNSGFQFRSGIQRHTTGISMWSKPFLLQRSDGTKLAVIVMDSQGLYDSSTNSDDNVRLFTVVSLLSSSLMLNTPQNINMKQLMELKYFMDYATTGSKVSQESKPFQRLTFLIRDYTLGDPGWAGGQEQLDQFMVPSPGQSEDVKSLARNLTKGFTQIDCFALPPPGKEVTKPDFNGSLKLIDREFVQNVETFVVNITETLQARKPLMLSLTAGEVADFVANITDVFNSQLPPEELMKLNDRTLLSKTIEKTNALVHLYEDKLQGLKSLKPDSYYLETNIEDIAASVDKKHEQSFEEILTSFAQTPLSVFKVALRSDGKPITALQGLRQDIEERYRKLRHQVIEMEKMRKEEAENRKKQETADREERARLEAERIRLARAKEELEESIRHQNEEEERIRSNYYKAGIAAVLGIASFMIFG